MAEGMTAGTAKWYQLLDFLRMRKRNYQLVFGNPAGNAVLLDLAVFCRARPIDTTFDPDARVHAALEGRREVYNRILQHLNYSSEELAMIFKGQVIDPHPEGE